MHPIEAHAKTHLGFADVESMLDMMYVAMEVEKLAHRLLLMYIHKIVTV